MIKGITEIEYLCGAKYRGQLRGKYRHGVGMIQYSANEKPIIGRWTNDKMILEGIEHPTRKMTEISVIEFS